MPSQVTAHEHQGTRRLLQWVGLFTVLALLRVPYYLTHHIQEDAFITWRCATNLVNAGCYSYNTFERVCATTSHAYALLSALVIFLARDGFIPVMLVINTICFLVGAYLISATLFGDFRRRMQFWFLISLLPAGLVISYTGMETSLLVLVVALAFQALGPRGPRPYTYAALALMPWIRPDAVAFGAVILLALGCKTRRFPWKPVAALVLGGVALAGFNYGYFGSVLHHTIVAKQVASHPDRTLGAVGRSLWAVFFGPGNMFLPIYTKYLFPVGSVFGVMAVALCLYAVGRSRKDTEGLLRMGCLVGLALLIPAAYAYGGIVFPWYLYPSIFFTYVVLVAVLLRWCSARSTAVRTACWTGTLLALVALDAGQWFISLSWGVQESLYRASVGRYIRAHSASTDTLFLEPAGYIPFYAQRLTYDEVGLGSSEITDYQRRYPNHWWFQFVQDKRPTFLVQRDHILRYRTYQGYQLTPEEIAWFNENYELIRQFHYDPKDYHSHPLLVRILKMGKAYSYYLFRLRPIRGDPTSR